METKLSLQIKELRGKGYSYNLISETLNCAKSSVSYHCGTGQKKEAKRRALKRKETFENDKASNRESLRMFSLRYKRFCGCKDCKIKNPFVLEFDHRDQSTKTTNVSNMISDRYSLKRFKEEIRKCDVVCANCHRLRTIKQLGMYKDIISI